MREHVKAILRRAFRPEKLNILVLGATHERYETELARTGHNFYSLKLGKEWNKKYSPVPDNYKIVTMLENSIEFDLILTHTSDAQRLSVAYELSRQFDLPIIRHTHTLPHDNEELRFHHMNQVHFNTFISEYSMRAWGYDNDEASNADFINHGIDTEFWKPTGEERTPHCLSVVNYWADRDWACGWTLWNETKRDLPVKVLGDNPGLSLPAPNSRVLVREYSKSLVFLNTSLNSPVPMSLIEAMACGCAIVSTDNCMIPEFVKSGLNGYLANDPEALYTFAKRLIDDPEQARIMGQAARQTIEQHYNINLFRNKWNQTFERVLFK